VRKWFLLACAAAACSRAPGPGVSLPGAVAPRQAAIQFLNAVEAQDLQAMSMVWGNEKGPGRDQFERGELDKRLIIMQGCYEHDRYEILDETTGTGGTSLIRVSLARGTRPPKITTFVAHRGPSSRYYVDVRDADFNAMRDFCPR